MIRSSLSCALGLLLAACSLQATADRSGHEHSHESGYHKALRGDYTAGEPRWWKGNTHTHSWWSDGDSPPENAAAWYREHGYDFLVISDHNQMQAGALSRGGIVKYPSFWYTIDREDKQRALAVYRQRFGEDWVETRTNNDGETEVRLKTLDEFRHLFEAAGEFIFVPGEEITTRVLKAPAVHMNGINLQRVIQPRGGDSVTEVIQNNLEAVLDQGRETGREMIAHVNHPNFRYAIPPRTLFRCALRRARVSSNSITGIAVSTIMVTTTASVPSACGTSSFPSVSVSMAPRRCMAWPTTTRTASPPGRSSSIPTRVAAGSWCAPGG